MTEIPEGADVRDDEGNTKLVLRAYLAEVDAPVFDGDAAAGAVVTELRDLVLERLVLEVVSDAGNEIKTLAGFAAITNERANLVRQWLLKGGVTGGG